MEIQRIQRGSGGVMQASDMYWTSSKDTNSESRRHALICIRFSTYTGAFYIGGGFEYDADGKITGYQAGRGNDRDQCLLTSRAPGACKTDEFGWTRISNSKVFLLGSIGLVRVSFFREAGVMLYAKMKIFSSKL